MQMETSFGSLMSHVSVIRGYIYIYTFEGYYFNFILAGCFSSDAACIWDTWNASCWQGSCFVSSKPLALQLCVLQVLYDVFLFVKCSWDTGGLWIVNPISPQGLMHPEAFPKAPPLVFCPTEWAHNLWPLWPIAWSRSPGDMDFFLGKNEAKKEPKRDKSNRRKERG